MAVPLAGPVLAVLVSLIAPVPESVCSLTKDVLMFKTVPVMFGNPGKVYSPTFDFRP